MPMSFCEQIIKAVVDGAAEFENKNLGKFLSNKDTTDRRLVKITHRLSSVSSKLSETRLLKKLLVKRGSIYERLAAVVRTIDLSKIKSATSDTDRIIEIFRLLDNNRLPGNTVKNYSDETLAAFETGSEYVAMLSGKVENHMSVTSSDLKECTKVIVRDTFALRRASVRSLVAIIAAKLLLSQ